MENACSLFFVVRMVLLTTSGRKSSYFTSMMHLPSERIGTVGASLRKNAFTS